MKHKAGKIEDTHTVDITHLRPDPKNARTHDERNIEMIADSLRHVT